MEETQKRKVVVRTETGVKRVSETEKARCGLRGKQVGLLTVPTNVGVRPLPGFLRSPLFAVIYPYDCRIHLLAHKLSELLNILYDLPDITPQESKIQETSI